MRASNPENDGELRIYANLSLLEMAPVMRRRIVEFVRALIVATQRLQSAPQDAQAPVAQAAELDAETVKNSWPYLTYPGALADDLLDVLVHADVWVAKKTGRAPRMHGEFSQCVDRSVLREALAC